MTQSTPHNQMPRHSGNARSGVPSPRFPETWEKSGAQSRRDKDELLRSLQIKHIAKLYPIFGNRSLPAHASKAEIIHTIENNKASSTKGETGSGKSTQIPQQLCEADYRVFHIVPRKNIADNLHSRITSEMSEHIDNADEIVGIIHGDYTNVHENNRITIMTANTFLLMENDIREQYGDEKVAIICDETHESNLYVDMAMGVGAWSANQQPTWRVHAISATQNEAAVQRAFGPLNKNRAIPNVHIEGRPFNVAIEERPDQFVHEVYADIGHAHAKTMIFTSGKNEIKHIIEQTKLELDSRSPESSRDVEFRILHGELTRTERMHVVNDPLPEGKRIVIVSTNYGTSGITVPGNTCVISDGTVNQKRLDRDAASGTIRTYVTQDGLTQQFGRAARDVGGGEAYLAKPTVIHEDALQARGVRYINSMPYLSFADRKQFSRPEIYESLLGQIALNEAVAGRPLHTINKTLPNPVEGSQILSAHEGLYRIGAMRPATEQEYREDNELYRATRLGKEMNRYPIRPELSRGVVEATKQGKPLQHMVRAALIAAALDAGGIQDYSHDTKDAWRTLLRSTTSNDWIAQLDIMQSLPGIGSNTIDETFVKEHDLNYRRVERAMDVTRRIFKALDIENPENTPYIESSLAEEQAAIDDLMAGMGDLLFTRTRQDEDHTYFRSIHGDSRSTERFASDRSVAENHSTKLIAGWPRYFIQSKSGAKRDIVELIAPTKVGVIRHYAAQHGTINMVPQKSIRINHGSPQQAFEPKVGKLSVGKTEFASPTTTASPEVQNTVAEYVLDHPGPASQELRHVASILESLQKSVPASILAGYKEQGSGKFLTNADINAEIYRLSTSHLRPHEIEQGLAAFIRDNSYYISTYFTENARRELQSIAPSEVTLSDGSVAKVHYATPDTPYVTLNNRRTYVQTLQSSDLTLPSNRIIFVKTHDSDNLPVYVRAEEL